MRTKTRQQTVPSPVDCLLPLFALENSSLKDLRKLQKNQFTRITKEQLIDAILAANEEKVSPRTRQEEKLDLIVNELAELRRMIASSESDSKAKIKELTETIEKQSEIHLQHQLFLEQLDRQKRETNLVLLGVPEEQISLDGATTEETEIQKVWEAVGAGSDVVVRPHPRLGRSAPENGRPRPLLIK
ncbi:hypothetical protein SK128_022800, partial [Halocaridina rubra]